MDKNLTSLLDKEFTFLQVQMPIMRDSHNQLRKEVYFTLQCLLNQPTWQNIALYFLTKNVYLEMTDHAA